MMDKAAYACSARFGEAPIDYQGYADDCCRIVPRQSHKRRHKKSPDG